MRPLLPSKRRRVARLLLTALLTLQGGFDRQLREVLGPLYPEGLLPSLATGADAAIQARPAVLSVLSVLRCAVLRGAVLPSLATGADDAIQARPTVLSVCVLYAALCWAVWLAVQPQLSRLAGLAPATLLAFRGSPPAFRH